VTGSCQAAGRDRHGPDRDWSLRRDHGLGPLDLAGRGARAVPRGPRRGTGAAVLGALVTHGLDGRRLSTRPTWPRRRSDWSRLWACGCPLGRRDRR